MNQVDGRNLTEVQRIIEQTVNKEIWASKVSPKMQLFFWKIIHGAIPLGENLAKRGMLNNISCRHCGELETADHLFLHCNFTRQVWAANIWKQNFNPSDCSSFRTALLASSRLTTLPPLGVTETLFQWVCWGIWTARNYRIFENRIFSPAEILSKAIFCAREWIVA
ncbi:unnamed protein product [Brassica oleracea]